MSQQGTIAATAPAAEKPLKARQRRFADELAFVDTTNPYGKEVVEAYARAGFAPHRGNAARLAMDPRVRAHIRKVHMDATDLAGIHLGRILMEIRRIALFNADDIAVRDADGKIVESEPIYGPEGAVVQAGGVPEMDYTRMTRDHMAAVAEIDPVTGRVRYHDKLGALRDLVKYTHGETVNLKHEAGDSFAELMRLIDGRTRGLPAAG